MFNWNLFLVKLSSFENVFLKHACLDTWLVQIRFAVTKGNPQWNHRITLEGKLDDDSCAVAYLARHLRTAHGLDLLKHSEWALGLDRQKTALWGLNKENMRYENRSFRILRFRVAHLLERGLSPRPVRLVTHWNCLHSTLWGRDLYAVQCSMVPWEVRPRLYRVLFDLLLNS
jgi:hypothetical protein